MEDTLPFFEGIVALQLDAVLNRLHVDGRVGTSLLADPLLRLRQSRLRLLDEHRGATKKAIDGRLRARAPGREIRKFPWLGIISVLVRHNPILKRPHAVFLVDASTEDASRSMVLLHVLDILLVRLLQERLGHAVAFLHLVFPKIYDRGYVEYSTIVFRDTKDLLAFRVNRTEEITCSRSLVFIQCINMLVEICILSIILMSYE